MKLEKIAVADTLCTSIRCLSEQDLQAVSTVWVNISDLANLLNSTLVISYCFGESSI